MDDEDRQSNLTAFLVVVSIVVAGFVWWLVGASGEDDDGALGFVLFVAVAASVFVGLRWVLSRQR